ncbi:MAG: nucleotidyltransferase domain-containing protein [Prevotellaceae bacterium]|jgi:predicted nucleotidyltransferase|nr:nucleotidyltransferase domain-containing protein [Prevotellaceae bacterium]
MMTKEQHVDYWINSPDKRMFTRNAVIKIVRNCTREIEAQGVRLRRVILFGSYYAKESQHEWSDIDVAPVADEFTGVGIYQQKMIPLHRY